MKNRIIKNIILSAGLLAGCASGFSQQPGFRAWAEFDTVGWMGDALNLKLSWQCDNPRTVRFPVLQDEFAPGLQIIPQDSLKLEFLGDDIASVTYRFSAYREGVYTIPAFHFEYASKSGIFQTFSDSGRVRLYAPTVDTTLDIKDIRSVFKVDKKELRHEYWLRYGFILWIVLAVAALIVGGLFLWKYIQKRRAGMPVFAPKKAAVPPVDKALKALKALKEKELWKNGLIKEYHTELTDILRLYLAEEFAIPAVEMTNEELCAALASCSRIEREECLNLTDALNTATLVKFAKSQPSADVHENSFAEIEGFLKKQKEIAEAGNSNTDDGKSNAEARNSNTEAGNSNAEARNSNTEAGNSNAEARTPDAETRIPDTDK